MPTLYDSKTQKPIAVDDSEAAAQLYLGGQAKVRASADVPVVNADGEIVTVAGKDLKQALESGMQIATDKAYKVAKAEARLEKNTGENGGPWWGAPAAALMGAARGGIGFGIPDKSLKTIAGLIGGDQVAKRVEEINQDLAITHPIAETLGEAGGMIAGSWKTAAQAPAKVAGLAKAARALQTAERTGNALRTVEALGELQKAEALAQSLATPANTIKRALGGGFGGISNIVSGGIEKTVTQAANQLIPGSGVLKKGLTNALGTATSGALEAGAMGASKVLNDSALYNDPVTAENLWATVSHDAILGAKVGGILGGAKGLVDGLLIKNSNRLHDLADKAVMQSIKAGKGDVGKVRDLPGGIAGFSQWIRDNGMQGDNFLETVQAYKGKVGAQFDNVFGQFDKAASGRITSDDLLASFMKSLDDIGKDPIWRKEYKALSKDLSAIINSQKEWTLREAWEMRQSLDSKYRNIFNMPVGKMPSYAEKAKQAIRGGVEDLIIEKGELAAKELNDPVLVEAYKDAKLNYRYYLEAEKMAKNLANTEMMRAPDDMLNYMAKAVGGAAIFGVKPALGFMAGKYLLGKTGSIGLEAADRLATLADYASVRDTLAKSTVGLDATINNFLMGEHRLRAKAPWARDTSLEEQYKKASELVKKLEQTNVSEVVAGRLGPLGVAAPRLTQNVVNTAARAQQYLASQLPKQEPTNKLQPELSRPTVTDSEKHDFVLKYKAVSNPDSVFTDMANGKALPVQVEAIKAAYPNRYALAQHKLLQAVAEKKEILPYKKQLQVATVMGTPVDSTMEDGFIKKMQAIRAGGAQQQQKPQQLRAPAQTGAAIGAISEMYGKNTQADRRMR